MAETLLDLLRLLSVWALPVLLAVTLHEAAHGYVARLLGDDTAARLGRVSLNPLRHVDPFGTVLLPGFLLLVGAPFVFGWAKPVPVAFHRLRDPRSGMVLVALAGPACNLAQAVLAALAMHLTVRLPEPWLSWTGENLANAVVVNVVLATFNMLPLPPLDGGRVVTGLLPPRLAWRFGRIERYGLLILLVLIFLVPMIARELGHPFNPLALVLLPAVEWLYDLVLRVTGW